MLPMPYHYAESGLDNVYIYNLPVIIDANGENTIYIKKINILHKAIANGIISKQGLIDGKEIRFLRTEMGYTQAQFSELLGKEAQACGRWDREENSIDKTTDSLIRCVAADYLKLKIDVDDFSKLNSAENVKNPINIDGQNYDYKLIAA